MCKNSYASYDIPSVVQEARIQCVFNWKVPCIFDSLFEVKGGRSKKCRSDLGVSFGACKSPHQKEVWTRM